MCLDRQKLRNGWNAYSVRLAAGRIGRTSFHSSIVEAFICEQLCVVTSLPLLGIFAGCGSRGSNSTKTALTPAVYTETNAVGGNSVVAYAHASDGSLSGIGTASTGGIGVGLPTYTGALPFPIGGATGAVTLSPDGKYLYAVDAGNADRAVFAVAESGKLTLIGRYPTGGTLPARITINSAGKYLYVLNTGSVSSGKNVAGGITGFMLGSDGSLSAIAGSSQLLRETLHKPRIHSLIE
jgi:DNA-binding beta-propeller fold protein YncE